jgi:hypothetical protein
LQNILAQRRAACILTPVTLACMLAACGGDGGSSSTTYSGKVVASAYKSSVSGNPALTAGYYAGATVFIDVNGNGVKDSGEPSGVTDATGKFTLSADAGVSGQFVADIPTSATNTAAAAAVPAHLILRASAAQVTEQGPTAVVISALSTDVQRRVEAATSDYATEKTHLATRLSGPTFNKGTASITAANLLADVNSLTGAEQYAVLYETNALANRYTYATAKLDRADKYPDALAVAGGDPRLAGVAGVTAGQAIPADTRTAITYAQAQQAAFDIEGVPAYDNIFVIVEENKSTDAILGNTANAPVMNQLLAKYNQLTTYYATGNPSEPNYTALGGGDDFGITDDNWFGCGATGANAPKDVAFPGGTASDGQPLVATGALPPADSAHLAGYSTTAGAACSLAPTVGTNHNAPGDNLFTLVAKAGLTVRTYSESMNPGQDVRSDSVADAAVVDTYNETDTDGANVTGTPAFALVGGLYKVKHGPSIAYQTARALPEFQADNRTIFGTQYTEADWKKTTAYTVPAGWMYDQFTADLAAGDVGNINFVVPDQCDDMHGVGTDASCLNTNNSGLGLGIKRADIYLNKVVAAIQNSALYKNPQKRVAIVIMFDEGEGSSTSCCGWNAGGKNSGASPVVITNGAATATSPQPTGYANGNGGHGNSIFGVITNQQDVGSAAKGVRDSDAYSHFSFVRTLQDMFQLADPAVDASYLNRAKYTEAFVAANITALPEFAGSADTHFDSVRPINHAYVIPAGYVQKLNPADIVPLAAGAVPVQTGPDATQSSVWAVK